MFLAHLDVIDALARSVCVRNGWFGDEVDDFVAEVRVKLMANDYAVVRKYQGRSSFKSFLAAVISNAFRDHRIARWGKWRPSANAQRLGAEAVRLERLIHRDGLARSEAVQQLANRSDCTLSERQLNALAVRLDRPPRTHLVPLDLIQQPDRRRADDRVLDAERRRRAEEAAARLQEAMALLDPEDQTILQLRFWEGMSVADISRTLSLPQKPLYRRLERQLRQLRSHLEANGVGPNAVMQLLEIHQESA